MRTVTCEVLGGTPILRQTDRERFVRHAREAATIVFASRGAQIEIRVVDDREMSAAHERFSGVPGTTDVLTFDLSEPDGPAEIDVLVCGDVAAREAAARGSETWRELLLYAVHAMLHCAGHDDHTEADAAAMHAREDQVLGQIGVGAVYQPGSGAGSAAVSGAGGTP